MLGSQLRGVSLIFLVHGEVSTTSTNSFSVIYPSGTPTVNYIDWVMFEWVATGAFTTAAVFCGQANEVLFLRPGLVTAFPRRKRLNIASYYKRYS
jgi:hypothetical protein